MSCNRKGVVYAGTDYGMDHYKVYIDDDTASDLATLETYSAGVVEAATVMLVEAGIIGSVSMVVATAIAAADATEAAWISIANDGCGVIMDLWYSPTSHEAVWQNIKSQ